MGVTPDAVAKTHDDHDSITSSDPRVSCVDSSTASSSRTPLKGCVKVETRLCIDDSAVPTVTVDKRPFVRLKVSFGNRWLQRALGLRKKDFAEKGNTCWL